MRKLRAPNDLSRDVYLDGAPAGQVSFHRAGLLAATKDMVNAGRLATATRLATAADSLMGEDPDTYSSVHDSDTIFNTRKEIHAVFVALSDSLRTSRRPLITRNVGEIQAARRGILAPRQRLPPGMEQILSNFTPAFAVKDFKIIINFACKSTSTKGNRPVFGQSADFPEVS